MPHRLSPRPSGLVAAALVAASAAAAGLVGLVGVAGSAHAASAVDLQKGSDYLVGQLVSGTYDESFPGAGMADFGLTIDTAFALAATGADQGALAAVVGFVEHGKDPSGQDLGAWTGITDYEKDPSADYRSGGSIAKAVLLEQVVGHPAGDVDGVDLLTNLPQTLCTKAVVNVCSAPGNYLYTPSTFGQSLGVMAQVRAGQDATKPVTYLASQQQTDGSFPSQLPRSAGDEDVDSTAMAAMALDLVPGQGAAVDKALAWLAGKQLSDGGFPGAAGNSTNSAGLAVQGLSLRPSTYGAAVARARAFLAAHQLADGGFPVNATETTSDVRASAQALGGSTGTSFGTLRLVGSLPGGSTPPASTPPTSTPPASSPPASTPAGSRPSTPASSAPSSAPSSGSGPGGTLSTSGTGLGSASRGGGLVDSGSPSTTSSSTTIPAPTSTTSPSSAASSSTSTSTALAGGSTTPPVRDLAAGPTSGPLAEVNPLWWVVLALAVAFGVAFVITLRRRPAGAHEAGARR